MTQSSIAGRVETASARVYEICHYKPDSIECAKANLELHKAALAHSQSIGYAIGIQKAKEAIAGYKEIIALKKESKEKNKGDR